MSKISLANKYRPKRFSDVIEQDVVKSILTEQLKNKSFKNSILFCGGAGTGKAQPLYSKVLTPSGFITMEEIALGDAIITGNGNISTVSGIYPQGVRPIYEITLTNGDKFRVSDEHLNVVYTEKDGNMVESIVTTLELLKLHRRSTFIKKTNESGKTFAYFNIKSIKHIADEECQCIYIEADEHTYITDNYIVTHNTTSARIFAKEVNNFKGSIIEIDAASHNSVEDVRNIIEGAYTQSLDAEYKVYLLDEVHMLSNAAWNALLKILEEPPKKTLFLMATTDPQKIPKTILSRVQRFNFQKISVQGIISRLKYIIDAENKENTENGNNDAIIEYEDSAIEYIAKMSDGGMRNAITQLDKCISLDRHLTLKNVQDALDTVDYTVMFNLTDALWNMDIVSMLNIVDEIYVSGLDLKQFIKEYNIFVLDLCKYGCLRDFSRIQLPSSYEDKLTSYNDEAFAFFKELLNNIIKLNNDLKWEATPKPVIESRLMMLCEEAE